MGHLTKWLFFNLMFSAIPYTLTTALNQVQFPGTPLLHPSSEVLFIAVVATSSALGELWDGEDHARTSRRSYGRAVGQLILLLGVLSSSLLYGAYVYHTLMSPGPAHGIDCSAIVEMSFQGSGVAAGAVPAEWTDACRQWVRVQSGFFTASLRMTGFWVITSTFTLLIFRSRRRWPDGMV